MVTRRFVAAVALLSLPIAVVAQQTRDNSQPRRGTAHITGVIVSNDTPSLPIRRAIVTLSGDLPGGRSVVSDDEGRFAFAQLPSGRFTITATKPAYLPAVYGTNRPGRPGTAISIADGQNQTITIQMARGAVVSGAVRDRNGQPLPDPDQRDRPRGRPERAAARRSSRHRRPRPLSHLRPAAGRLRHHRDPETRRQWRNRRADGHDDGRDACRTGASQWIGRTRPRSGARTVSVVCIADAAAATGRYVPMYTRAHRFNATRRTSASPRPRNASVSTFS